VINPRLSKAGALIHVSGNKAVDLMAFNTAVSSVFAAAGLQLALLLAFGLHTATEINLATAWRS
jgi:hypothetical protein